MLRTSLPEEAEQEIQHALTAQADSDAPGDQGSSRQRTASLPAPHRFCGADTLARAGRDDGSMTETRMSSWAATLRSWSESVEAAAIAGLAFAALSVIASLLLMAQPAPSETSEVMSSWYADSGNRWSVIFSLVLTTVAAIAFLWFIAVIRRRAGEREDQFFATVFLGSGILITAILLVGATAMASIAIGVELLDGPMPEPGTITIISGLANGLLLFVLPRVQAIFIITTSTVGYRTGAFPRWLSLIGYLFGLGMFVLPLLIGPALIIFPLWVGVMGAVLLVRRKRADAIGVPEG
jgi:hypothetical protein